MTKQRNTHPELISVRVSSEMKEQVEMAAQNEDRSVSDFVRVLLKRQLSSEIRDPIATRPYSVQLT